MGTAYSGARVLIGRRRHRARVEHDYIGFARGTGAFEASRGELALDGGAIRLCGPASKVLKKKSCH
jgi:hypothetical protein